MSYEELNAEYPDPTAVPLKRLLDAQPLLVLEYNALCRSLPDLLDKKHADKGTPLKRATHWNTQLQKALHLNLFLQRLYKHTGASKRAQQDLKLQRAALETRGPNCFVKPAAQEDETSAAPIAPATIPPPSSDTLRLETGRRNPLRLLLPRGRRFILLLQLMLSELPEHATRLKEGYQPIDVFAAPIINILSWIFLLPRMVTNLYLFGKHVRGPRLKAGVEHLTWTQRFKAQIRERWFELANDLIWVPGGFITCFLLLGPLAMVGLYLTIAMFCWDVVICSARAIHELTRLSAFIAQKEKDLISLTAPLEQAAQITLIQQLKTHLTFEKKRHALSIVNSSLGLIFTFFALSCIALPLIVPFIAACLLIPLTLIHFYLNFYYIPSIQPGNPIAAFSLKDECIPAQCSGLNQTTSLLELSDLIPGPAHNPLPLEGQTMSSRQPTCDSIGYSPLATTLSGISPDQSGAFKTRRESDLHSILGSASFLASQPQDPFNEPSPQVPTAQRRHVSFPFAGTAESATHRRSSGAEDRTGYMAIPAATA
ncbi:MAG: hypothetical protein NTW08_04520 [Gammaproteobacteria bacterium]|nr:hypothetical protein [Gammaproteobacteria bacterium]